MVEWSAPKTALGLRVYLVEWSSCRFAGWSNGQGQYDNSEFIRFLKYSRRSASEVQSQAYLALDQKYMSEEQFHAIYDEATQVKKLINAFIGYLVK